MARAAARMLWPMQATPHARIAPALVRIAIAAIFVATGVGVIVPMFADATIDDSFVRILMPLLLAAVAVIGLLQMRFIVLPGQLNLAVERPAVPRDDMPSAIGWLCVAFSVSDAIYGVVLAIMLDAWWYAPAFGAFALLALAIYVSYANERLEAISVDTRSRGLA
jgi:hypothetical protein